MEKERLGYLKLKKERLIQKYGKEAIISFISIFVLVFLIAGSSFAIFTDLDEGTGHNTVTVGSLSVTFDDTATGLGGTISLTNALPKSDAEGILQTPYKFRVTNSGNVKAIVTLTLENDTDAITTCGCNSNLLDNNNVRYQLIDETNSITYEPMELTTGGQILRVSLNVGASVTYSLNTWIKSDAPSSIVGRHFHKKLIVSSSQETPLLLKDLIIGEDEENVITTAITTTKAAVSSTYYDNAPTSVSDYQTKVCDTMGNYYVSDYCQYCDSNNANYNLTTCTSYYNNNGAQSLYTVENGVYKVTGQDSKDTYFYRGNIINNYVLFAGSNWRIVRVNEDDTIRLVKTTATGTASTYNALSNASTYLGYTYDGGSGTEDSAIKTSLESWYDSTLSNYDKFVSSASFCNDTSSAYTRANSGSPSYACSNSYLYDVKIGLLSSDELIYAGLKLGVINKFNILRQTSSYFTMSAYGYSNSVSYMLSTNSIGEVISTSTSTSMDVYPVINLAPTVKVTGTGTSADPYVVTEM